MRKLSRQASGMIISIIGIVLLVILIALGERIVVGSRMLEFYIPAFKSIRTHGLAFAGHGSVSILGSVSRDYYFSEAKVINLLFMLVGEQAAYILGFLVRYIVSITGMFLLAKEILGDHAKECRAMILSLGIAVAVVPVEAYYWLAVSSIPLLMFLILNIKRRFNIFSYLMLLIYPIFSELTHVGLYLFVGILLYAIICIFTEKRFHLSLVMADILLAIGYLATDYRLIRLSFKEKLLVWDSIILPWSKPELIAEEVGVLATIVVIVIVSVALMKSSVKNINAVVAVVCAVLALLIPVNGNSFTSSLVGADSAKDYYSKSFMKEVREGIDYMDQWICTYDMPASVLIYNDFRTIDGDAPIVTEYLKYYDEEFPEVFDRDNITGTAADIDIDKFKEYDGRMIISGRAIEGLDGDGWVLLGSFADKTSEQMAYVYCTESRYVTKEHKGIPYEERTNLTYNLDEIYANIDAIEDLAKRATEYKEANPNLSDDEIIAHFPEDIEAMYDQMIDDIKLMQTCNKLVELDYYKNIYDEEVNELQESMYKDILDFGDRTYQVMRTVAGSPYKKIFDDTLGKAYMDAMLEYEDMTDEEKERQMRIVSLEKEYDQASMEDYYFEYKGEEWSFESFNERAYELEPEDLTAIYNGLYSEKAKVIGEIYKEIIQLDNEIAKEEGYDSYVDYAYEVLYNRDYSAKEIKDVFGYIKRSSRYIDSIAQTAESLAVYDPGWISEDDTSTYEMLYPYIDSVDEELGVSLKYLMDNHLYDLKASETKPSTGFSAPLDTYGDMYIFDSPYGASSDLFTFVHEFGHANNYFYTDENPLQEANNQDVAEIQSQGLELLIATRYDEIFDKNTGTYLECRDVSNVINAVSDGSIIAEFEIYAFEHPEDTADEYAKAFLRICNQHGYYYDKSVTGLYTWVDVPHLFTSPLYYVAYMTSGLSALELYAESYEDYDRAVEKYMQISTLQSYWSYRSACDYVGMDDIFKSKTVPDVMRKIDSILKKKAKEIE